MRKTERTCAVCRNKADRESFVRIVRLVDGQITIDNTYKLDGRGVYICKNQDCISRAIKTKAISRSFKKDVGNQIYDDLGELL